VTLERHSFSDTRNKYRRLATGADTVMPDFAVRPFVATDSSYRALELARQRVTHIRLCRAHPQSAPIHVRAHNNTKLKSP
jgi:hypothetical protein